MLLKKLSLALALAMVVAACGRSDAGETAVGEPAMEQTDDAMSDETMDDMSDETMDDMSEETMDDMSDETMDDMSEETMDDMSDEAMDDNMAAGHTPTSFTVTIRNTSDSAALATPLAPGVYAVHSAMDTLFAADQLDRGEGLEALAEDGDPSGLLAALGDQMGVKEAGAFSVPEGATEAAPALPGSSYAFTFEAVPGDYLSFATMFVQSNDWFLAPASSGIGLFDEDDPLDGDITELVLLWDAGTEVDETPSEGPNQAPRQSGPNTGEVQGAPIAVVDGFTGSVMVTITAAG